MPIERITLEELSKISDKAERINVSDYVRSMAEEAATRFCDNCKYTAQRGKRSYSEYAGYDYGDHIYIFTDRSAINEGKGTIVDWAEFRTYPKHEEDIKIIDDFIYAVGVFIKKAGISKFNIKKISVESPPSVWVDTYSFFGLHHHGDHISVPSWYVEISTQW